MGPSPVTYLEIDAYERLTFARLTAWQVALIRRLDDALLAIFARDAAKPVEKDAAEEIPATDARALKGLFRGLATRREAKPGD